MSLPQLLSILTPPTRPHFAISDWVKWEEIERKFGLEFPLDFKQFIGNYGTGTVGDFILVFNPFSDYEPTNFFYNMKFVLKDFTEHPDTLLPLFPKPSGLLPFAKTYDGDNLYWRKDGESNDWSVIAIASRSTYYEVYPTGMIDFFIQLLVPATNSKKDLLLKSKIFRNNFERTSLYISVWETLENALENVKQRLQMEKKRGRVEVSRKALVEHLYMQGLTLEFELVQEKLENWQNEKFIELVFREDIYLRIKTDENLVKKYAK